MTKSGSRGAEGVQGEGGGGYLPSSAVLKHPCPPGLRLTQQMREHATFRVCRCIQGLVPLTTSASSCILSARLCLSQRPHAVIAPLRTGACGWAHPHVVPCFLHPLCTFWAGGGLANEVLLDGRTSWRSSHKVLGRLWQRGVGRVLIWQGLALLHMWMHNDGTSTCKVSGKHAVAEVQETHQ